MGRPSKNPVSVGGGVGESRMFVNPDADQEIMSCHVNGKLVSEMIADGDIPHPPPHAFTDEGLAERLASMVGKPKPQVQVLADYEDKHHERFADRLKDDLRYPTAVDPQQAAILKHVPPGFRGSFLNDKACDSMGTQGYEPLLVDGKRITVGDGWLGVKPEDVARQDDQAIRNFTREMEEDVNRSAFQTRVADLYQEEGVPLLPDHFSIDRQDPGIVDDLTL